MKNMITIALLALVTIFTASCGNKRAEIAEQRIAQLTDSLIQERNENKKLGNQRDSLGHKFLLTMLKKVEGPFGIRDSVAITDTTSYRQYLKQCKVIDSLYKVGYSKISKSEMILDEIKEQKRKKSYAYLFAQLKSTPEYPRFVEQLVKEHFSAFSIDDGFDLLTSKYNSDWEDRFYAVEGNEKNSVAFDALYDATEAQYEGVWQLLKSKNLPVK